MFTITFTRQQFYELYYEGLEATVHFIEGLLEELANQEQILGERQRRIIDAQHEGNERQAAHLKRVKEELWRRRQSLNSQLTRRLQEPQAELGRREELAREARRDSHNPSLPPALDLPAAKASNSRLESGSLSLSVDMSSADPFASPKSNRKNFRHGAYFVKPLLSFSVREN